MYASGTHRLVWIVVSSVVNEGEKSHLRKSPRSTYVLQINAILVLN